MDRLNQKRQTQKRGLCRDHRLEGVVGILELEAKYCRGVCEDIAGLGFHSYMAFYSSFVVFF